MERGFDLFAVVEDIVEVEGEFGHVGSVAGGGGTVTRRGCGAGGGMRGWEGRAFTSGEV